MSTKNCKYIFISGGVASSLGKGIAASSIGALMELYGFKIAFLKMDPYINVDAGTMSPYQHGEVFVTEDGAETDLDLGNYERFTNSPLTRLSSVTTGQIYQSVINKERAGAFDGETVQVIPHITSEIKDRIRQLTDKSDCDIVIVEIGGTVGDIESFPFLEAVRQFAYDVNTSNEKNAIVIHLTMTPSLGSGELKTKPTQHSVRELRSIGILPDIILCRTQKSLSSEAKEKIALFCNVKPTDVVEALDVKTSIYEIPITYNKSGFDKLILNKLKLNSGKNINLSNWSAIISNLENPEQTIHIAVIGKYMNFDDTYKSLYEAIIHAGIANKTKICIHKKEADSLDIKILKNMDGVLIPGGFGSRGSESIIKAIEYARLEKIPILGICFGLQLMCIEYARNVLALKNATSEEFETDNSKKTSSTKHFIVSMMQEQKDKELRGGTMRLGTYPSTLKKDSLIYSIYKKEVVNERHRHRFEVNNDYIEPLESKGLIVSGRYKNFVESIEITDHPWAIGVQFHPELRSKIFTPHKLFVGFIKACLNR